ncbi:hypothetical protein [Chitinivorax sp. B]|uniref:hypothetical protein n=1 Tax=Chitinivorax sp. B TaxID=2502235 RepID=UPI0010F4FBF4|nr:hypothetical protein [Chitinivorax sp. B]
MSSITLSSPAGSFTADSLYVGLALRHVVIHHLQSGIEPPEWLADYREELYLSSWNDKQKSFFLTEDDDFELDSNTKRRQLLSKILIAAKSALSNMDGAAFLNYLATPMEFDDIYQGIVGEVDQYFIQPVQTDTTRVSEVVFKVEEILSQIIQQLS